MIDRIDAALDAVLVGVDDEIETELLRLLVAKFDHVAKLPRRVDVQQRKRQLLRMERLAREMQQNGRVLADRIHQHGLAELGRSLAENMDALRFEEIEMRG